DLDRGNRNPPDEPHRVNRDADALPDERHDAVYSRPADARLPGPEMERCADARAFRDRQRNWANLVDAVAVPSATLGRSAVQLPVAGVGNKPRLHGMGRRAKPGAAGR